MNKLNVCLVSPFPPPYGGIAHWGRLIDGYAKSRQEVRLTVIDIAPRWRSIHDKGVVKRVLGGGLQMCRDMAKLLSVLFRENIGVVHLTTPGRLAVFRDVGVLTVSRIFCIPLVYHIRFGRIPDIVEQNSWEWRLIKFVVRHVYCVIAIDNKTASSIRQAIPSANVEIVPNCMNLSALPVQQENVQSCKSVLFAGWVVPTKGIDELLRAWEALNPFEWKLQLAGPGDSEYIAERMKRFAHSRVEFLGELSHDKVMISMANCSVFVLPSHTEGFPNAVLEAMALGRAIVATAVGAIPEMLDNGKCGVLVSPHDVEGLVKALAKVIGDESFRKDLGKRARSRAANNYSIVKVFDKYVSIWGSASGGVVSLRS